MSVGTKGETSVRTGKAGLLMSSNLRKLALTTHLVSSIGWVGAVAGFVALDVAALNDGNAQVVSAAYLSMALITRFVIVPLALVALLTGLIQALGTSWGLFRHYWVLAKLAMTLFATIVLLNKVTLVNYAAFQASGAGSVGVSLLAIGRPLAVHSIGGLIVLLIITIVSVYKPWGLTLYGQRRLREQGFASLSRSSNVARRWVYVAGIVLFLVLLRIQHLRHLGSTILEHHGH